jgi:hypothetical protein
VDILDLYGAPPQVSWALTHRFNNGVVTGWSKERSCQLYPQIAEDTVQRRQNKWNTSLSWRIVHCNSERLINAAYQQKSKLPSHFRSNLGKQVVSRRLPTAAARVRVQVRSCGICDGQSGTGAGFLRVLRFPLPIFIPPAAPHSSSSIIQGWYSRPNSGRRTKWTQSHPTPRNKKISKDSSVLCCIVNWVLFCTRAFA